ncbi:hypothetical protein THAOC_36764 [Thalassiosira oceanica]|uniref:Uncharacterized protein n=1 Tax=Thalassiosira oceanica TaxID=159749 RepID=K0QZ22_THAOC|nr:hypothetical protein THAOC_36764 [Thalassiosira oceanica]|eukprot:EJK44678.1 hypothetical protein THAOC_36764 [Thalassiosira oceanica]
MSSTTAWPRGEGTRRAGRRRPSPRRWCESRGTASGPSHRDRGSQGPPVGASPGRVWCWRARCWRGGEGAAAEIGPQGLTQLEAECTALLQGQSDESLLHTSLVPEDQLIQGFVVEDEPVYMASHLPPTVEVVAPSDLPEGYVFDAVENGKSFSVTVPAGGSVAARRSAPHSCLGERVVMHLAAAVPPGPRPRRPNLHRQPNRLLCFGGRMAFAAASRSGVVIPHCGWDALLGQVQNRLGLNWHGERAYPGDESPFEVLLNVSIFAIWFNFLLGPLLLMLAYFPPDHWTLEQSYAWWYFVILVVYWAFNFALGVHSIDIIIKTRLHIRERSGIPEKISGEDCCCATFCQPCTVMQMARHTADYETCAARYCSETGLSVDAPQLQFGGAEIA